MLADVKAAPLHYRNTILYSGGVNSSWFSYFLFFRNWVPFWCLRWNNSRCRVLDYGGHCQWHCNRHMLAQLVLEVRKVLAECLFVGVNLLLCLPCSWFLCGPF